MGRSLGAAQRACLPSPRLSEGVFRCMVPRQGSAIVHNPIRAGETALASTWVQARAGWPPAVGRRGAKVTMPIFR